MQQLRRALQRSGQRTCAPCCPVCPKRVNEKPQAKRIPATQQSSLNFTCAQMYPTARNKQLSLLSRNRRCCYTGMSPQHAPTILLIAASKKFWSFSRVHHQKTDCNTPLPCTDGLPIFFVHLLRSNRSVWYYPHPTPPHNMFGEVEDHVAEQQICLVLSPHPTP